MKAAAHNPKMTSRARTGRRNRPRQPGGAGAGVERDLPRSLWFRGRFGGYVAATGDAKAPAFELARECTTILALLGSRFSDLRAEPSVDCDDLVIRGVERGWDRGIETISLTGLLARWLRGDAEDHRDDLVWRLLSAATIVDLDDHRVLEVRGGLWPCITIEGPHEHRGAHDDPHVWHAHATGIYNPIHVDASDFGMISGSVAARLPRVRAVAEELADRSSACAP